MAEYGDDRSNSSRQGVLPLLLRCDLSTSSSLFLQHEAYSALFISVTTTSFPGSFLYLLSRSRERTLGTRLLSREHDDDVRDIGKHDIGSVLLFNAIGPVD